jgi:hypothetical protein
MKNVFLLLTMVIATSVFVAPLFGFDPVIFGSVITAGSLCVSVPGVLMNGMVVNNINSNEVFQQAKRFIIEALNLPAGQTVNDQMFTQSTIRGEVVLTATATQFHIPISVNDPLQGQNQFNTERRLGLQDLFGVTSMAVFIALPSGSADASYDLFTYPTLEKFSGAQSNALRGFYANGYMKYTNNGTIVTPYWDLKQHYKVPNQQFNAVPYYAANTTGYIDEVMGTVDGFIPVSPSWVFSGASNMDMNVNIPANMASVAANTRLVVLFRGILFQNLSGVR